MNIQEYTQEQKQSALKYISCDALLLLVCDALARSEPFSTVRMGDGERALIRYYRTGQAARFLYDGVWLREYGLFGADLKMVGQQLYEAAINVDCLCPNIAGLTLPKYEILSMLPPRDIICEGLYAHTWLYMGRVPELMSYQGGIGVVCRNSNDVADRLFMKFGRMDIEATDYGKWEDYSSALDFIGQMKAHMVLVAAGPSGKRLCVEASKKFGKVVLDVGSALVRHWSVSKTRNY